MVFLALVLYDDCDVLVESRKWRTYLLGIVSVAIVGRGGEVLKKGNVCVEQDEYNNAFKCCCGGGHLHPTIRRRNATKVATAGGRQPTLWIMHNSLRG